MRIARITRNAEAKDSDPIDLNLITPLINKYQGKKGAIIPLLQGCQEIYGYLPRPAMEKIAKDCAIT